MSDELKADLAKFLMEGDVFWSKSNDDINAAALLIKSGLVTYSLRDGWRVGCEVTDAGKRYIVGGD